MTANAELLTTTEHGRVARRDVLDASEPLLAEAWTAQRLLTLGQQGIELTETDGSVSDTAALGGRFSTSIAGMLSCLVTTAEPKIRRDRRLWQEQLLRQQAQWPDIAATNSWTHLLCSDHSPAEYGLPRPIYPNPATGKLACWRRPKFDPPTAIVPIQI